jgi:upstream-binding transcription factor
MGKKPKISSPVDEGSSSEMESDEDLASDEEDSEIPPKTTIQKPNSSLQMFCNSNIDKYSSKHPKLTKQELTRLMAKEFAKLSEEKKKVYGKMAQKSKNELSATSKKSLASTISKVKNSKITVTSKKSSVKSAAAATALKSPERNSSSKKFPANSDSKSSSKIKPSLNANAKSSTEKKSSKTPKSPIWAANQLLFKTEKMNEPPKPPE